MLNHSVTLREQAIVYCSWVIVYIVELSKKAYLVTAGQRAREPILEISNVYSCDIYGVAKGNVPGNLAVHNFLYFHKNLRISYICYAMM